MQTNVGIMNSAAGVDGHADVVYRFLLGTLTLNSSGDEDRRNGGQPSLPQGHPQDVRHTEQQQ